MIKNNIDILDKKDIEKPSLEEIVSKLNTLAHKRSQDYTSTGYSFLGWNQSLIKNIRFSEIATSNCNSPTKEEKRLFKGFYFCTLCYLNKDKLLAQDAGFAIYFLVTETAYKKQENIFAPSFFIRDCQQLYSEYKKKIVMLPGKTHIISQNQTVLSRQDMVMDNDNGYWSCDYPGKTDEENDAIAESYEKEYGSPEGYGDIVDVLVAAGVEAKWC